MSETRLTAIVIELLEAVGKMEADLANKIDRDVYERDLQEIKIYIAKIEGLLHSRSDINFSVNADKVDRVDASTNQNITNDQKTT